MSEKHGNVLQRHVVEEKIDRKRVAGTVRMAALDSGELEDAMKRSLPAGAGTFNRAEGVGIYAVMSYLVSERAHEIGIRVAIGARRADIVRLVVGQGAVLTVIGVAIGSAAALALTRLMGSLLFGITPADWPTFVAVSLLLAAVALAATWFPARRATKVDPLTALRQE